MQYRAEIDGLRALAVIPVILFHANIPFFSGGFVGVDVFFVISGFLITNIILSDRAAGRFTFMNFYERRVRRILPPLFLVLFATIPFAWIWISPNELVDYALSLGSTTLFGANLYFLEHVGYFSTNSELRPLLHMWSLAVEEQFYLLLPLLLIMKSHPRIVALMIGIWIASFFLSELGWRYKPSENFFFTPSRFWEILSGCLCAFYMRDRETSGSTPLAGIGLLLILIAIFTFEKTTPSPSFFVLMPVVGTCLLLIFGNRHTIAGKLLAWRPFVFMGLLSYSAYLWHQPLFAFARIRLDEELSFSILAVLIGATFVLAFLSYKFIETPIRKRTFKPLASRTALFATFGGLGVVLLLIAGYMLSTNGAPNRHMNNGLSYSDVKFDEITKPNQGLSAACDFAFRDTLRCRTDEQPETVFWGDSFTMHLVQAYLADNGDAKIIQHTKSACLPVLDIAFGTHERRTLDCMTFNDQVFADIQKRKSLKRVVMSLRMSDEMTLASNIRYRDGSARLDTTQDYLRQTVAKLEELGLEVVVVSPIPQTGHDIGQCLLHAMKFKTSLEPCNFTRAELDTGFKQSKTFLNTLPSTVKTVLLDDVLCGEGQNGICPTSLNNTPLYRDRAHFSVAGSKVIGEKFGFGALLGR